MNADEMLRHLRKAKGPHRNLDQGISVLIGYQRQKMIGPDGSEGVSVYLDKEGNLTKVPDFTRSLDSASEFVEALLPGGASALTWDGDVYKDRVWGGPACEAEHPALALRIAALAAYLGESL
jgi:hypothetical protein